MLDDEIIKIERSVYTLFDLLSELGGIVGLVFPILQFLVSYIEYSLYVSSIMKKMFYYDKRIEKNKLSG